MRTILLLVFAITVSCSAMETQKRPPIAKVIEAHKAEWMKIEGVNGVGETEKDGKPAVLILVDTLTASLRKKLPVKTEGYSVVIDEIGVVRPLQK